MDSFMRSASLGPPKRAEIASGLRPRVVEGGAEGSLRVADEFSTPHLRSSLRPGSIMCGRYATECEGQKQEVGAVRN